MTEISKMVCDERHARIDYRLEELEKNMKEQNRLIIAIEKLANEILHLREDLNETIKRLAKLEESSTENSFEDLKRQNTYYKGQAKKWDKFKWLIVAGSVTLFFSVVLVLVLAFLKLK